MGNRSKRNGHAHKALSHKPEITPDKLLVAFIATVRQVGRVRLTEADFSALNGRNWSLHFNVDAASGAVVITPTCSPPADQPVNAGPAQEQQAAAPAPPLVVVPSMKLVPKN